MPVTYGRNVPLGGGGKIEIGNSNIQSSRMPKKNLNDNYSSNYQAPVNNKNSYPIGGGAGPQTVAPTVTKGGIINSNKQSLTPPPYYSFPQENFNTYQTSSMSYGSFNARSG